MYLEGELQTRKWQDQNGNDRYSTEVVLQGYNCNLTLLGSGGSSNQQSNSIEENQSNIDNDKPPNTNADKIVKSESNDLEDDIPF